MIKKHALSATLLVLMTGILATPVTANATGAPTGLGNKITECVPYQYQGADWQKCTNYFYSDDGVLLGTSVYYIDEAGVWHILP